MPEMDELVSVESHHDSNETVACHQRALIIGRLTNRVNQSSIL